MSGAHTPGPWHYRRGDEWLHSVVTHDGQLPDGSPNCWAIAEINKNREPEHEANARLIAAAPELLAACLAMIEWDDREQDHAVDFNTRMGLCAAAFEKARAAIAKAAGSEYLDEARQDARAGAQEEAYAEGRKDEREDNLRLLAWAYRKLMPYSFSKQEDALAMDEIKLMLDGYS